LWLLYRLATILLGLPGLLYLRLRHGGTLGERLGLLPRREDRPVWIQAVSVGEVRLGLRLCAALEAAGQPCLLTATTATGLALAAREGAGAHPFPADLPWVMGRALRRLGPRAVVLVETELWPGLLRAAQKQEVPVLVVNGRLSDRSLARTLKLRGAFGASLQNLHVAAQSEEHARRFAALGVPAAQVQVVGNLKYDLEPPAAFEAQRKALRALVPEGTTLWTAGSVREGEEAAVLGAHALLRECMPEARLVLAPRHLDRAEVCLKAAAALGLKAVRRTWVEPGTSWDVLVLDTMGELWAAYATAEMAFVGGSLVPLGGQNPLEPAFLQKPLLFGPSMENFREVADLLLAAGGARSVSTVQELGERLAELAADPAARAAAGQRGLEVVQTYRGATTSAVDFIRDIRRTPLPDGPRP